MKLSCLVLREYKNIFFCFPVFCLIVSEWLLLNANSAIFQLYHVNFQWDDEEIRFVPDQHTELGFYCASSLKQQSGRHVIHSDTLFWFQANQCLLFLLNAEWLQKCSREARNSLLFDLSAARTHDVPYSRRANHYTTNVFILLYNVNIILGRERNIEKGDNSTEIL
jgi:hypothetical protein